MVKFILLLGLIIHAQAQKTEKTIVSVDMTRQVATFKDAPFSRTYGAKTKRPIKTAEVDGTVDLFKTGSVALTTTKSLKINHSQRYYHDIPVNTTVLFSIFCSDLYYGAGFLLKWRQITESLSSIQLSRTEELGDFRIRDIVDFCRPTN